VHCGIDAAAMVNQGKHRKPRNANRRTEEKKPQSPKEQRKKSMEE